MHGNNPTRDSIERALDFAVSEGLIRSWKQVPFAGGARHAKWEVEVHPNVHSADGLGTYLIRTYQEANLFCAALASARSGMRSKIDDMQQNLDQLGDLAGRYQAALGIEPGDDPGQLLDNETDPFPASYIAQTLTGLGLTGVTVGQYGSFPVVITGIIPAGDAGLHVFRVAESLAGGRAHSTAQDRMSEPLWAGIFEPNSVGWVTSPIEAWDGLTVQQVRDKITGYL